MPVLKDKAIGVIVYFEFPRSTKFLIVKHKKGHWSFCKGHKEKGETPLHTAKRELYEEAGISEVEFYSKRVELKEKYNFTGKDKDKVRKVVDYFIAKSVSKKIKIDNNEITDYRWATLKASERLLTFKQSRRIVKKAYTLIKKKKNKKKK